jgi:fatty-acyl-CoA synthase
MYKKNLNAWPPGYPEDKPLATQTVFENLQQSFDECADKSALVFYDTKISYRELYDTVAQVAGWLVNVAGVNKGDRVAIIAQNSPQSVIAYYATLRAGAVVVPLNPMYVAEEVAYLLDDSNAKVIFSASDLSQAVAPAVKDRDVKVVGIAYNDYIREKTDLNVPAFILESLIAEELSGLPNYTAWSDVLAANETAPVVKTAMDELIVLPYTSGSTGMPKGCMHTNTSVQHGCVGVYDWHGIGRDDISLAIAPFFHVVGMQAGMNVAISRGATLIIQPRWDREVAAQTIQRYGVTVWPAVPTMVIDMMNMPNFDQFDISTLRSVFGGGSAMPESVAIKLKEICGVTFNEGYGMTETICPTTANPPQAPRTNCVGLSVFNTHIRVVDPDTLQEVAEGDNGEILISGPQVMQGYWKQPEANEESFVEMDGKRYLRSGDLGYIDKDGYVYIVDRIKRMINASGFKVWPTQVEAVMHRHPAVAEVCIIGAKDPKRGETVKALIVPKANVTANAEEIELWSRDHLATYKVPRIIEFVESLPKSGSGKVLWRELQEQENRKA